MIVGAHQKFQFFIQITWFLENNCLNLGIGFGITWLVLSNYKKNQSLKTNFKLTTRATLNNYIVWHKWNPRHLNYTFGFVGVIFQTLVESLLLVTWYASKLPIAGICLVFLPLKLLISRANSLFLKYVRVWRWESFAKSNLTRFTSTFLFYTP